jgi:manganese transport system substrate-binding protein
MNRSVLICALLVAAVGSGAALLRGGVADTAAEEKKTVLTTFTVIADIAREVAGDKVTVVSLTKPGVEIHGYEPTPGDLVRASGADLILDNGLNLELWASKLYASIPDVPHVTLTDGVDVVPIAEGAYKDKPNPHAWMSPVAALIYVENIRKALSELEPEHAEYFEARAEAYSEQIRALDAKLRSSLSELSPNHRFLVTCEGAFTYLIRDYDLREVYLWPINDESQGTPQQIARVVDIVKKEQIPTVFCESTIAPSIQAEVAAASGAKLGGLLYVDSLSDSSGPAPTYLKLLEHTVSTVISGLAE